MKIEDEFFRLLRFRRNPYKKEYSPTSHLLPLSKRRQDGFTSILPHKK